MTEPLDTLAQLYARVPGVVRRGGLTYPVAVVEAGGAVLAPGTAPVVLDPALVEGGRAHLDALRAGGRVHDGDLLCLDTLDRDGEVPVLRVVPGGYFAMLATCDAVRAELLAADAATGGSDGGSISSSTGGSAGPGWDALPLRARAHEAAGDPLVSGRGRAAAVGVCVLLAARTADGGRGIVLGRRSERVGADPGRWHVAPSGMLEPAADGRHLATTVATELREELGVVRDVDAVAAGLHVLGVVTDLARLRPDVVAVLDLGADAPDAGDLVPGEEFSELDVVPLSAEAFADLWRRRPPATLTAPAAGALALTERFLLPQ